MTRPLAILQRILSSAVGVLIVLLLAGTAAVTLAQSAAPKITSVTVSTVTNNSAEISFGTDVPTGAKILYGKTTAYGSSSPGIGYSTPATTNHVITLAGLEGATTYHYQIEVNSAAGTTKSADRTFTTRSGTGTTGPLILNNIVADCIDTRCQILFSPNRDASVRVVWDTTQHADFNDFPAANIVAETAITPPTRRALIIPNQADVSPADGLPDVRFSPGTIYYYRLQAFEAGSPSPTLTTANLQFTTSLNNTDHTFSTGGCIVPTVPPTTIQIGQCGAGGYYCPPGGGPAVQDCTKSCGYVCPTNSTCRASGVCEADPSLSGSPFQCNKTTGGASACFDDNGQFKNPAPAGCYATWGKCNANTILKVQKDRGCNLWLTCATSVQTEPQIGQPAENLCLTLAACNSLNQQGQCNSYLPQGQCDNDALRFCATDDDCLAGGSCNLPLSSEPTQSLKDLTFTTPNQVKQIANLSGNVLAGLDWNQVGGSSVIQGNLPWQLMRQVGGNSQITNGDFEYNPPSPKPWEVAPLTNQGESAIKVVFEAADQSHNHVLRVLPVITRQLTSGTCQLTQVAGVPKTCTATADCTVANDRCVFDEAAVNFSGAVTQSFQAAPTEIYYAEARIRAPAGTPKIRFQFGHNNYTSFSVGPTPTYIDVNVTNAWQRVTLGPITGMSGATRLAAVCADNTTDNCKEFWLDDVQVRPVLQVSTNPAYVTPSCRLYPKADSPSCDYSDPNGVHYRGWYGYCLENDSVTGTCLSWWPVDIIKGEASIFGTEKTTGYQDRAPLYLCAESIGTYNTPDPDPRTDDTTFIDRGVNGGGIVECSDPPNSLCGKNFGNFRAMSTAINRIASDNTRACGDDVENRGCNGNQRGICLCDHRNYGGTFGANTVDQAIHRNEVAYFRLVRQRFDNRFSGFPDLILSEANNWSASWNGGDNNAMDIRLNWSATDGHLVSYTVNLYPGNSDDDDDATGFWSAGLFFMKERCTKLVEVVRPDGLTQSYAGRVNDPTYKVADLNYYIGQDLNPFGGALQPMSVAGVSANDPSTWTSTLNSEAPDTAGLFDAPYQSRAGSAYACEGNCSKQVCSTDIDNDCSTPAKVSACLTRNLMTDGTVVADANTPDIAARGVCVGVEPGGTTAVPTPTAATSRGAQSFDPSRNPADVNGAANNPFFAQERIRRLFTQSYGIWNWSSTQGRFVLDLNSDPSLGDSIFNGWRPPSEICPLVNGEPKRGSYPDDYCAVPPKIIAGSAKFLSSGGSTATITGGSGSIGLKFNTDADIEQTPLQEFTISWGDTVNSYAFPYAPRNDSAKPHIFSHVYNNTGPTCGGTTTTNCCTITNGRKTCDYEIRIQVKDNWGWCNDAVRNGNSTSPDTTPDTLCTANDNLWYNTGLTVRVQP